MKPHNAGTALKRLERLKHRSHGRRTIGAWPKIMDAESWSALAVPMQAQLMADARDDTHGVAPAQESETAWPPCGHNGASGSVRN